MSILFARPVSLARNGVISRRIVCQARHYTSNTVKRQGSALAPVLACTAFLAASGLFFGSKTIFAESLAPEPMKQDLLPEAPSNRYASDKEVANVIELLRKTLKPDQVTTNPDELLGHGHSANTYHSRRLFQ